MPAADTRPRRFVDLHTHSTASDGRLTPSQIVALAEAKRLAAVALTDHDTLAGLPEAAQAAKLYPQLRFVPGIEVSVRPQRGTMHMLGLGIDPACPEVGAMADFFQDTRRRRNPRILARLEALGMKLSMADVLAAAGAEQSDEAAGPERSVEAARPERSVEGATVVGRPHIAEAMYRKRYVRSTAEAFDKYLARGCPAYVERERLTAEQAVAAIHAAGGLAVAAHPAQWLCDNFAQLERILRDLIDVGADGVEAYHSDHGPFLTRHLIDLAVRLDIAILGGSDFHGPAKPGVDVGHPKVPLSAVLGPKTKVLLGISSE